MFKKLTICVATTGVLLMSLLATAEPVFSPYTAVYELKRSIITAELNVALKYDNASGVYEFSSRGSPKGIAAIVNRNPTDQASFTIQDKTVRPLEYEVDEGAKNGEGNVAMQFDWSGNVVILETDKGESNHAIKPGMQSPGSADFSTRLVLINGEQPGDVTIVDEDGPEFYIQKLIGEEKLSTEIGELDTIHYRTFKQGSRRQIERWVAPELQYLPVQIIQTKDGKPHYVMKVQSYQVN